MDNLINSSGFYEQFWADTDYHLTYAFDSAVRDRFPAIQKVWGEMSLPRRVLDYGSGNGVLTYWMFANNFGSELLGIDISNIGVESAKRQFERPCLQYRTFDPNRSLDSLGRFDVVVASHVLEHIPDPRRALAQMLPLSEWFLLEVPLEECLVQEALAAVRRKERRDNALGHLHFWTKKDFRRLLESCGLILVRDFHYASAPFSPYHGRLKRWAERAALSVLGTSIYGHFMATHYIVLAYRHPAWQGRVAAQSGEVVAEKGDRMLRQVGICG
jgi:SAM-dependent methyltransferase